MIKSKEERFKELWSEWRAGKHVIKTERDVVRKWDEFYCDKTNYKFYLTDGSSHICYSDGSHLEIKGLKPQVFVYKDETLKKNRLFCKLVPNKEEGLRELQTVYLYALAGYDLKTLPQNKRE